MVGLFRDGRVGKTRRLAFNLTSALQFAGCVFFSLSLVVLKGATKSGKWLNKNSKLLNSLGMLDTHPGW